MTFQNAVSNILCDKVKNPYKALLLHIEVQCLPQGIVKSGCKLLAAFFIEHCFYLLIDPKFPW